MCRDTYLSKSCAKANITRRSFHPTDPDVPQVSKFLEKVTADIAGYLNCPSRQGFKYVFGITDVATKMIWKFPLRTRSGDEVLGWVKHSVSVMLPMYPGNHQLLHYHADGGAELVNQNLKSYLLQAFGTRVTWSSIDTPELNSILERKFRTLGEMTLACQNYSGRMHMCTPVTLHA